MELSQEQLALLNQSFPVGDEPVKLMLPRFGMLSKDITEESGKGKNKEIKIIQPGGTFYIEKDEGEKNEEGKNVWTKHYIDGETVDVTIVYFRYQLRYFDKGLEKFYSSPIYDNAEQVLPLYLDKKPVMKGTEKDLQSKFPDQTASGKPSSKLKKYTILYVVYNGELHQFNLPISSGWEFSSYKRRINPSTVVTTLSSSQEEAGTNVYYKTLFNVARPITQDEFDHVVGNQDKIKQEVEATQLLLSSGAVQEATEIDAEKIYKDY